MRFTNAIVRTPAPSLIDGLTSADLGQPDFKTALIQHAVYCRALKSCGLEITVLPPDDRHPDSTFVEDTALLTPACAIIMRPGAPSRRGETDAIARAVAQFYSFIEYVREPGTVDAGDIMMVGNHYYIGRSDRTNAEGADQVIRILERYGLSGEAVPLTEGLHLKSGLAYLENSCLVAAGAAPERPEFRSRTIIRVDDDERYAANCLWINGTVLVAAEYPKIRRAIEAHGYTTIALDVSEFRKLDGGLSCLSLRF